MEQTWRWYGPQDPVSLKDIRQAGATGIVTALHHIPNGAIWHIDEIRLRQKQLAGEGFKWSVVESVPVHEEIKTRSGDCVQWITNYRQTLRNLAHCGIDTICYNFMPVVDWTRTDLAYQLPNGAKTLRFDHIALAAFELFILRRKGAEANYSEKEIHLAETYHLGLSAEEREKLTATIIAGLPGAEEGYTLQQFRVQLQRYDTITKATLCYNLQCFLEEIVPACEEVGVRLAIHPDDPPRPILGLPRIVSTLEDIDWLFSAVPSPANGLTMCTGSFGVREDNDLPEIINRYASRIHFAHLRSTQREKNSNSFHEASHLEGNVDMFAIIRLLVAEEQHRSSAGDIRPIPMRPDHGHQMLDDLSKQINPGYSAIGRLKGLAEIRGMEFAIRRGIL
ncbi:mannonate dehydratase [Desulfosediminicola sp.]|uniref:mannonate dehydratase n=1 Tax=Desulfosediminicola sp. TaxID=2886825 RepID=UPI003AF2C32E